MWITFGGVGRSYHAPAFAVDGAANLKQNRAKLQRGRTMRSPGLGKEQKCAGHDAPDTSANSHTFLPVDSPRSGRAKA